VNFLVRCGSLKAVISFVSKQITRQTKSLGTTLLTPDVTVVTIRKSKVHIAFPHMTSDNDLVWNYLIRPGFSSVTLHRG